MILFHFIDNIQYGSFITTALAKFNIPPIPYFSFKLNIACMCRWWGALKKNYVLPLFYFKRQNFAQRETSKPSSD